MDEFGLGRDELTLDVLNAIATGEQVPKIPDATAARIDRIRTQVDALLADDAPNTYGVNTGFGALAEVRIDRDKLARLQVNLIRSHATGIGNPFPDEIVRAMMLLRANVLCLGTSGVRRAVPALLVDMIRHGIHPQIPQKGSVGASGDLAPLAHLALVLIGEGRARWKGEIVDGGTALAGAGLKPVVLAPKEGIALINGTQVMTADLGLTAYRAQDLVKVADIAGAASLDALLGTVRAFDPRIHIARLHPGQQASAENLRRLLEGSQVAKSHHDCGKVQDPYSLRCMPQVHGATRDTLTHVIDVITRECNAATDNPLVFEADDGTIEILSGGNFHGQPVALVADFLGIAIAELANVSERRIEQLVNPTLSSGLPPFLAPDSGLNSGFMIAQVTAAALVSENKILAHPASVDSIPSSANREDHVSMGTIAARKARMIAEHVEVVLAIELLCAVQGLDLRRPLKSSPAIEAVHACVRAAVPYMGQDRTLHPDIEAVIQLIRNGAITTAVEAAIGPLQ